MTRAKLVAIVGDALNGARMRGDDLPAAALAAIEAAGYVVVPREVTNPMLDAAMRAWTPGMNHAGAHEERYRAMIAASPLARGCN